MVLQNFNRPRNCCTINWIEKSDFSLTLMPSIVNGTLSIEEAIVLLVETKVSLKGSATSISPKSILFYCSC